MKIFSLFVLILTACLPSYAQRERAAPQATSSPAIHIERPVPGKDGFSVYAQADIRLSAGTEVKGKWLQTYSIDIKAGEHFHLVATAERFNIGLLPKFGFERLGLFSDTAYSSGSSYAYFDSVLTTDGTLSFLVENESAASGDETYAIQVVLARESVRDLDSEEFCDKLMHLANHSRYDFFMLKHKFLQRVKDDLGFVDVYESFYLGDEIEYYKDASPVYRTVAHQTKDINEAKKMLDQYNAMLGQCVDQWKFTKTVSEQFDEELGKKFGAVSYTTQYKDGDDYSYTFSIGLGLAPDGKTYIVLLQLYTM